MNCGYPFFQANRGLIYLLVAYHERFNLKPTPKSIKEAIGWLEAKGVIPLRKKSDG